MRSLQPAQQAGGGHPQGDYRRAITDQLSEFRHGLIH
jgi:hypothetical protein